MTQALSSVAAEDLSAITDITDRFVELMLAGDFAAASRLYTEAAVVMPPHQPAATGRAAIQQWMASLPRISRFTAEIEAIDGRADLAYVRGRYSATFQTPDGSLDDVGKFLEVRKRQPDGSWLMEADIFNSDLPQGAAGTS